jgi:type I restriction-modification system DNA methylase subunit
MWSLCLNNNKPDSDSGTDNRSSDSAGGFDHGLAQSPPILPRVFDPCMGIGAFLCEYLTRLISRTKAQEILWNDGGALKYILAQLPDSIWGVEIDPFAYKLGKLNIMVHMFPLYQQCLLLGTSFESFSINRLSLFRNDSLRLDLDANPYTTKDKTWEQQQLLRLRDPAKLDFDYVVTNPPYMIRKTGFVTNPDKSLYDEKYLGGKGTQAYMYFMWFCLQRCHPVTGQLCFITPSQWTVLEFAESLR